jgi:hypothetical protein
MSVASSRTASTDVSVNPPCEVVDASLAGAVFGVRRGAVVATDGAAVRAGVRGEAAAGASTSHTMTHTTCATMANANAKGDGQIHGVPAKRNDGKTEGCTTDDRAR